MDEPTTHSLLLYAESLRYPAPGRMAELEAGMKALPAGSPSGGLADFLEEVRRLSLGSWEELHTRTLDLNPPAAPYIGFQTWGESYQRGVFLSQMSRELIDNGINADGELPDHLVPVLRYLARVDPPLPGLVEAIGPALKRMIAALRKVDPANPYLHLMEGIQGICKEIVQ